MDDLISRQQAIEAVVGCTNCGTEDVLRAYVTKHSLENGWTGGIVDALDAIEQLPSAQPVHKTGRWIEMSSTNHTYKCSVCGRLLVNITDGKNNAAKNYPYCHCGADMRGEQNG